jgi:hypothetical protein
MTTWNNRVVNRLWTLIEGETEEFYEIKEVFYDENDKPWRTVGHALALKLWSLCVKWLPDCMRHLITPC